ncbi:hypothetical protein GOODEAATRI_014250 [Goodea atripinnis]|uniref:Transferrin receptor protein 1 n=1 Tax=Goodea atripinnis TaxID=208336 RepID=A0ABV0NW71_9TELE
MEGDNSHVEMKLSSDMDEEVGENGVGEHHHHNSNGKPYVVQKLGHTPKNLCYFASGTLLIFIIGKLQVLKDEFPHTKLVFRMSSGSVTSIIVLQRFKEYGMNTWTDEHFIKVQDPPTSGYNKIVFRNMSEERQKGFLSYSGNGSGAVLYAHYGQEVDFRALRDKNINMNGRVMLVRAGKISFAEKVANAAKMNASAVLIYPDQADYKISNNTELYGHVSAPLDVISVRSGF